MKNSVLKPDASPKPWQMSSCTTELLSPTLQLIGQMTLVFSQHSVHCQEMLLKTIYQRNWKLLIHYLLLSNDYQPSINKQPVTSMKNITMMMIIFEMFVNNNTLKNAMILVTFTKIQLKLNYQTNNNVFNNSLHLTMQARDGSYHKNQKQLMVYHCT